MKTTDLLQHQSSAARRGFINELVAVQGYEPAIAKRAYVSVSAAGDKRAEKIKTLAAGIKAKVNA